MGLLSILGVGENPTYGFDQQQKDFIKLQFKYGLLLKKKLAAGTISQAYYDSHLWLTTENLEAPYNGWWTEFKAAIDSEDLQWLASQVGETVDQLIAYMGDAIEFVAKTVGHAASKAVDSTLLGLLEGLLSEFGGYIIIGGLGFATYYAYKKGFFSKLANHELSKLIP